MKLTVIGGGGVRSMFLAKSIAVRADALGIKTLVFMDIDTEKLNVFGGMAAEVAKRINPKLNFILESDKIKAVKDADYVITTLRVGGDGMRVADERAALSRGILGQETTGAAGFSFAMRSIPVLKQYCELIKNHAKPGVKVFNFTNPAGIVSEALRAAGYDFTYGICDAPSGMLKQFADLYGGKEATGECYGLNHLSFFKSISLDGEDITEKIKNDDNAYKHTELKFFSKELVNRSNAIPNEYLYYFYYREKAVANILAAGRTRGEVIAEINKKMIAELKGIDLGKEFPRALNIFEKWYGKREAEYMANETGIKRDSVWHFDLESKDEGGYAGVALKFIELQTEGKSGSMVLCVPNKGAIEGLSDTDVIEATCTITKDGAAPHKVSDIPELNMELIRRVKLYERLGAKAINQKSISLAEDALMVHPLINSYSLAKELAAEYLKINGEYAEGWK